MSTLITDILEEQSQKHHREPTLICSNFVAVIVMICFILLNFAAYA
jgi:hypothetical protein